MVILEIIFAIVVTGLVLVGIVIALIVKVLSGGSPKPRVGKEELMEEAKMIQEMYRGLSRLEQRVDALETLLLERGDKRGTADDAGAERGREKEGNQ